MKEENNQQGGYLFRKWSLRENWYNRILVRGKNTTVKFEGEKLQSGITKENDDRGSENSLFQSFLGFNKFEYLGSRSRKDFLYFSYCF